MQTDTVTRLRLRDREFTLVGTAHVSRESVEEVRGLILSERPDRVCVELDESRHRSLMEGERWRNLDLVQVLRQGKGFLLAAQMALAAFQRRLGLDLGVRPGEEMIAAMAAADEAGIPYSLCDRDIQVTLKRAWGGTGLWGKNKMIATLLASVFTREKLDREEIERLKDKSALHGMLEELASFLPSVKTVLIDERDEYLASRVYAAPGARVLAVVGAGHVQGMVRRLEAIASGAASADVSRLDQVPASGAGGKLASWIVPAAIVAAIVAGFFVRGPQVTLVNVARWALINGSLAALGSLVTLAHPLTILVSFVSAPIASLNPFIGVGFIAAIVEAGLRRPRVGDFERLNDDIATLRGLFRNRVTHALLIFFVSSLGGAIGNFIGGVPIIAALFH
jgi:pheromone shutdown-related protein TraB